MLKQSGRDCTASRGANRVSNVFPPREKYPLQSRPDSRAALCPIVVLKASGTGMREGLDDVYRPRTAVPSPPLPRSAGAFRRAQQPQPTNTLT
jgi:hypothetical protein